MYSIQAYRAAVETLIHAVEIERLADPEFAFGSTPLGPHVLASTLRHRAVIDAFFAALPADEQAEVIIESCIGNEREFVNDPWVYVAPYLTKAIAEQMTEMVRAEVAEMSIDYGLHLADARGDELRAGA